MTFSTVVQSSAEWLRVYRWMLDGVPVLSAEVGLRTVLTMDVVVLTLSSDDEISC